MLKTSRKNRYIFSVGMAVCLLWGWSSFGALTFVSFGPASKTDVSGTPLKIYGGIAHPVTTFTTPSDFSCGLDSTCNTCVGPLAGVGSYYPCNTKSVFGTTDFSVQVSGATTTSLTLCSGSNTIKTGTASGGTGTITATWDDICKYAFTGTTVCSATTSGDQTTALTVNDGATCSGASSIAITAYVSAKVGDSNVVDCTSTTPTGLGICAFTLQEGDGKIYFTSAKYPTGFPVISGDFKFTDLVAFVKQTTDRTTLSNNSSLIHTMAVDSSGGISPPYVDGLTNEVKYCITTGNKDITGNIYRYFDVTGSTDQLLCKTPSEVVGILSDKKCFIATAAFGSPMDAHVEMLRQFRNKFLFSSDAGKWFVRQYYNLSPQLADHIAHNETLRTAARTVLWPLVFLADLSVKFDVNLILILGISLVSGLMFLIFRRKRKAGMLIFFICIIGISANAQQSVPTSNDPGTATPGVPSKTTNTSTTTNASTTDAGSTVSTPSYASPDSNSTTIGTPTPDTAPVTTEIELDPSTTGAQSSQNEKINSNVERANLKSVAREHLHKDVYDKDGQKQKGLYKVDKEGAFYYRTKKSAKRQQTSTFRVGQITAPQITATYASGSYSFEDIYPTSKLIMLDYSYEWQPLTSFGKLGIMGGFSFFTAQGNGRYASKGHTDTTTGKELKPLEEYTFYAIPLNLGVIYKLDLYRKQWFAPYVSGGGTYYLLVEHRDDNKNTYLGTPAVYGAVGGMFKLTAIDRQFAYTMDAEYGVSDVWLTAEFRRIQSANPDVDMSTNFISVGMAVDY